MAKQTNSEPSRGTVSRPGSGNGNKSGGNITRSEPSSGSVVKPKLAKLNGTDKLYTEPYRGTVPRPSNGQQGGNKQGGQPSTGNGGRPK